MLAYGLYWLWLAVGLMHAVNGWIGDRQTQGVKASYASVNLAGFPLRVSARLNAPRIESPLGQWQGDFLSVSFAPFAPDRVRLVMHGANHLSVGSQSWDISSSFIRTDLSFDSDGPFRVLRSFQMTAGDTRVATGDGFQATVEGFGLSVLPLTQDSESDYKTPWASFVVTAAGLNIGGETAGHDVAPVALVEASGRVMGALSFDTPARSLARWSQNGGVLEFDRVVADWPPVAVQGAGTLAFDANLQPQASFSTQFRGMGQFADGLERAGSIDDHAAKLLRTAFSDTAKPDGKGHVVQTVPLTVQNGKLWAGSVALAPVPELHWPGASIP